VPQKRKAELAEMAKEIDQSLLRLTLELVDTEDTPGSPDVQLLNQRMKLKAQMFVSLFRLACGGPCVASLTLAWITVPHCASKRKTCKMH